MKRKRKIRKYADGGSLLDLSSGLGIGGGILEMIAMQGNTRNPQVGTQTLGGLLKGAGTGFSVGGPIGAAVGGVIGGVTGLIQGRQRKRAMEEQEDLIERRQKKQQELRDKAIYSTYPQDGVSHVNFFRHGGQLVDKLKPVGGRLKKTAPGVSRVIGDDHGIDTNGDGLQGVPLLKNGRPLAEVEGGETITDNGQVFSKRLKVPGTDLNFAEASEQIARVTSTNSYKKLGLGGSIRKTVKGNTNMRKQMLTNLAKVQKGVKPKERSNYSLPIGKDGLDLSSIIPFTDNIANLFMTSQTPEIPVPELSEAPQLNTDIYVGDQEAAINSNRVRRNRAINRSTGSSAIARSNMIAGDVQDTEAMNKVYGDRTRQETALQNQQATLNTQTANQNAATMNQFRRDQVARKDDITGRNSANIANFTEDLLMQERDKKAANLDKQKIALTAAKYLDTGVLERSNYDEVLRIIEDGGNLSDAMAYMRAAANARGSRFQDKKAGILDPMQQIRGSISGGQLPDRLQNMLGMPLSALLASNTNFANIPTR